MIANDVLKMLESRHAKDAFFSEVAIDSNRRRMDAWAMIPSYSKSLTIAYEIKASFNNRGETSDEILSRYSRYDVLVIDEVGLGEWSAFDATKLSTLIDNRASYFRKTVFLTNLSESGYLSHFNDQCISRLHQDGDFYIMTGRDLRYEC